MAGHVWGLMPSRSTTERLSSPWRSSRAAAVVRSMRNEGLRLSPARRLRSQDVLELRPAVEQPSGGVRLPVTKEPLAPRPVGASAARWLADGDGVGLEVQVLGVEPQALSLDMPVLEAGHQRPPVSIGRLGTRRLLQRLDLGLTQQGRSGSTADRSGGRGLTGLLAPPAPPPGSETGTDGGQPAPKSGGATGPRRAQEPRTAPRARFTFPTGVSAPALSAKSLRSASGGHGVLLAPSWARASA